MYQRTVKVARVLEENKKETQALNLERRKREFPRQGFLSRSDKYSDLTFLQEKGNNLCSDHSITQLAESVVRTIVGGAYMEMSTAMNEGRGAIRGMSAQNL